MDDIQRLYDELVAQDEMIEDASARLQAYRNKRIQIYAELRDNIPLDREVTVQHGEGTAKLTRTMFRGFPDSYLTVTRSDPPKITTEKPRFGDTTYDKPTRKKRAK